MSIYGGILFLGFIVKYYDIQVPISAVSTSSHSEQSSQARQSRWYCRNRWESRSVPNFIRRPAVDKTVGLSFCPYTSQIILISCVFVSVVLIWYN